MAETLTPEPRTSAQPTSADSGREVADEDFLFHLYRGSELLQDDRVHEAKESLERALTYQPRDAKGQDLLAVVYFRLGLFARATQIYETLRNQNPREPSLRLNLALCYLKTSQAGRAREELEALVKAQPDHRRAWGYLGLAYERTGDVARAQEAFERGGHAHMARRVTQRVGPGSLRPSQVPPAPAVHAPGDADGAATAEAQLRVQQAAGVAFQELDAGELSFSLAAPPAHVPAGNAGASLWHAVEIGTAVSPASRAITAPPPPFNRVRSEPPAPGAGDSRAQRVVAAFDTGPGPDTRPGLADPPRARSAPPRSAPRAGAPSGVATLPFPDAPGVVLYGDAGALVTTSDERPFALRMESIRAFVGAASQVVLERRVKDALTGEPLGGTAAPIVKVAGPAGLVVRARSKGFITALRLENAPAYVREDLLLGFDLALAFESGKLSAGDAEVRVVQLRGAGVVLLDLTAPAGAIPVTATRHVTVRREAICGWLGRLVPRVLTPAEAPAGQRGLLSFAGEGTVLVLPS